MKLEEKKEKVAKKMKSESLNKKMSYGELHKKYHAGELSHKQIQEKFRMDDTRHIHGKKANCKQCDL